MQCMPKRLAPELANALKQVLNVYKRSCIAPRVSLVDGEFEKLKAKMGNKIEINTTSDGDPRKDLWDLVTF